MANKLPEGFGRTFDYMDKPCIGVFGPGYAGKTRFCVTAGEWSASHDKIPGWVICDRKTRQTIKAVCEEMGLDVPLMNKQDFLSSRQALKLANSDDEDTTKKAYTEAFNGVTEAVTTLASLDHVEPVIIDSGTVLWDWIGYARLGRREGVKARYWGPSKRDWTDLFEALKHKTVLVTLWERGEWKSDALTGKTIVDGPPHISYSTTTLVRLHKDPKTEHKYGLDITESLDNKAFEGSDDLLTGEGITFNNLMSILRPEDE